MNVNKDHDAVKDTILLVDDEVDLLTGLKRTIEMALDCTVFTVESARAALDLLSEKSIDLVLADIRMPGMDGIQLLETARRNDPNITMVIMTAYGTIEKAVEAIKFGAYDFIQKPFDEEDLLHLLRKSLERNRLVRENERLMRKVKTIEPFENMVGRSPAMQEIFRTIEMLARTDVTVLLLGETGTGKDLAAQAIHAKSHRGQRPLLTVNCPALPESILESELFGYKKGAFTNASQDKEGLFVTADGGTVFLDEIADLSPSVQTKLLRFLQDKTIQPLGSTESIQVDVRIIAATNQDLSRKMRDRTFREDLYFRLNVASLVMPKLNDIREDIPLLMDHFLKKVSLEQETGKKKLAPEVVRYFMEKDWPGNIRELENTIRGWCAVTAGDTITGRHMPDRSYSQVSVGSDDTRILEPYKTLKTAAIDTFTVGYLRRLLTHTQGNITLAAKISGIKRQSLQKIVKRYNIPVETFRSVDTQWPPKL
jgi:DNA-binding NtrC family response regulator